MADEYSDDSNTLLLERIEYRAADGTLTTTLLDRWTQTGGEWAPRTISRIENGKEVMRIEVATAATAGTQPVSVYQSPAGKP